MADFENYIYNLPVPNCAPAIDGNYFEKLIPGYRTNSVTGRDVINVDIKEIENVIKGGSVYQSKRDKSRDITVNFTISTDTLEQYHKSFDDVKGRLSLERSQFIFKDEQDVFYKGVISSVTENKLNTSGSDIFAGTGSFVIHCSDPYKYSVQEYVVTANANDEFVFDYYGNEESKPILESTMASTTGYVAFADNDGNIIQAGDPDSSNGVGDKSEVLISGSFNSATPSGWSVNANNYSWDSDTTKGGTFKLDSGYLKPDTYVGSSKFYGPSITHTIPNMTSGSKPKNWQMSFDLLFPVKTTNTALCGAVDIYVGNISLLEISKLSSTPLSEGFLIGDNGNKEPQFYKPYVGIGNGHVIIEKFGSLLKFSLDQYSDSRVANQSVSIINSAITDLTADSVTILFKRSSVMSPMQNIGIKNFVFIGHAATNYTDVPNKFNVNDVVDVDVESNTILLNGGQSHGLGVIDNAWDDFKIQNGSNVIKCLYSNWATKPVFKLKYREVFK